MSTSLGQYTLVNPDENDGIVIRQAPVAASARTIDGGYHLDYIGSKAEITLEWSLVSVSEWQDIYSAWLENLLAAATLTLPTGVSYTVLPDAGGFEESHFVDHGGDVRRSLTIKFHET